MALAAAPHLGQRAHAGGVRLQEARLRLREAALRQQRAGRDAQRGEAARGGVAQAARAHAQRLHHVQEAVGARGRQRAAAQAQVANILHRHLQRSGVLKSPPPP